MFDNLQTSNDVAGDKDILGGGGVMNAGLKDFTVDKAYLSVADSGAMALNVHFVTDQKQQLREQFWMTSGKSKGGKNYYEKNGEKFYLPGFLLANALCLLTVGKEIGQLVPEDKMVNLYDFDQKKEVPTKVKVYMDLCGKQITAGVLKVIEDKTKDSGTVDAQGKKIYTPTGETREKNEIDKFFRARDGLTVAEITAKVTEPAFKQAWADKNTDQVKDKRSKETKGKPANPGVSGGVTGSATAAAPVKSLFED